MNILYIQTYIKINDKLKIFWQPKSDHSRVLYIYTL